MGRLVDARKQKEDDFFTKRVCDRCGAPLTTRIMSMYNMDVICPDCKQKERERSDYRNAADAELEALKSGDRNFKGIGYKPITTTVGRLEE